MRNKTDLRQFSTAQAPIINIDSTPTTKTPATENQTAIRSIVISQKWKEYGITFTSVMIPKSRPLSRLSIFQPLTDWLS
jgi:hypothetical protein